MGAYGKPHGVIFAVAHIRESESACHRRIECSRRSKSVDAQSVVPAVVISPFKMGYQSRRNHIAVKVGEGIGADHHRAMLLVEFVDDASECVGAGIYVVAVKLNGKSSTAVTFNCHIPAAAYSVPLFGGDDVDETRVTCGDFLKCFRGAVGGVIVDYNHIEFKIGSLA